MRLWCFEESSKLCRLTSSERRALRNVRKWPAVSGSRGPAGLNPACSSCTRSAQAPASYTTSESCARRKHSTDRPVPPSLSPRLSFPRPPPPRLAMLASILALPSAAVSGTANYLNNRRRGLAYTAGALGGAYVLGQWAVQRVLEGAEKGRKENGERDEYVPYSSLDPHASFSALRRASSLTPPPPTPPRRPPQPLSPVLAQPPGQPVHRPRPRPDHRLSASAGARRRGAVQSAE